MLNIVFFITEHFNFLCSNLQFEYWKWYQIMDSKQQLFMDTQSVPQSLSLWGWSGRPILGIGRARHTCLGHPLSSHFLLTIIDRKPGHKDSYTITCILWLMLVGLCPKFGCAVTLVGHSWNSMWMVACIPPNPSFPDEVLYVQEVWLWSWPRLRLSCCHHLPFPCSNSCFLNFCCIYYDCIFWVIFVILFIIIVLLFCSLPLFVLPMPWRLCRRLAVCRSYSVIRAAFSRLGTNEWAPVGWLPGLLFLVPPFNHCLLHLALCWWKEMPFHPISWNNFSFRVIILSPPKWKVT